MRRRFRGGDLLEALRGVVASPERTARVALYLTRDDGYSLGWELRRTLSVEARRRLAVDLLRLDPVVLEFEADGFAWNVPTGDEVTGELLAVGEYTATEVDSLRSWLEANGLLTGEAVVEVGANLGTTTLPLARAGWQVLALEPIPRTFDFLVRNVEQNAMSGAVTCSRVAASDHTGTAVMAVTHALAASRVVGDGAARQPGPGEIEVSIDTLDAIVETADFAPSAVAFVWCDAEGHESSVMRGGTQLWTSGVPLYAECGPTGNDERFAVEAAAHFRSFVPATEITRFGAAAAERDISRLPAFIGGLSALTSVLLLPERRHRS